MFDAAKDVLGLGARIRTKEFNAENEPEWDLKQREYARDVVKKYRKMTPRTFRAVHTGKLPGLMSSSESEDEQPDRRMSDNWTEARHNLLYGHSRVAKTYEFPKPTDDEQSEMLARIKYRKNTARSEN